MSYGNRPRTLQTKSHLILTGIPERAHMSLDQDLSRIPYGNWAGAPKASFVLIVTGIHRKIFMEIDQELARAFSY